MTYTVSGGALNSTQSINQSVNQSRLLLGLVASEQKIESALYSFSALMLSVGQHPALNKPTIVIVMSKMYLKNWLRTRVPKKHKSDVRGSR